MTGERFEPEQTYENVFLVFLDTAGHSDVVATNPRDRVYRAMDLLQQRVRDRLTAVAQRHRCARAQLWRWAGDGGFLVLHDDDESVARDAAVELVRAMLDMDLRHLREEFADRGIRGELHLRVGVHRGVVRYRGEGLEGSIYSPDINLAAHLEHLAPPDMAAVSAEVHQVAGEFTEELHLVGAYRDRPVYLYAPGTGPDGARRAWLAARGPEGAVPVHATHERVSQQEKARLIAASEREVIEVGTSLRTAAHYLVTSERPTPYRNAVLALLRGGGRYRCVLLDPESKAATLLAELTGEPVAPKVEQAMANLRRFHERLGPEREGMGVYFMSGYPGAWYLAADPDTPQGMIFTSPYLFAPPGGPVLERGDMPHYLVGRAAGRMYENLRALVLGFADAPDTRRVL